MTTTRTISNTDDIIDSRDVIARIEELEERFRCDCVMIADSYFEDYAQELASDVVEGYDLTKQVWPFTCIDWTQAARELQMDYTSIQFDGAAYWIR